MTPSFLILRRTLPDTPHHAHGDGDTNPPRGADQYHFENTGKFRAGGVAVGRLENLDAADRIYVAGAPLDLLNLPSYVSTVAYGGVHNDPGAAAQQWLLIGTQTGGHIFYALEDARIDMTGNGGTSSGRMESHFIPADMLPVFSRLRDIAYVDPENTLPPDARPDDRIAIKDHDRTIADMRRPITGGPGRDTLFGGDAGEVFVRYLPAGAILLALVDGQDLDEITVHTARSTFDLMA